MADDTDESQIDSSVTSWHDDVERYLQEAFPDRLELNNLCEALIKGKVKLYTLVENLEKYLTSNNVENRSKGTRLLADVVHHLPHDMLAVKELEFITAFFCDRLKDHHSVVPHVLYGLLNLCKLESVDNSDIVKVVQAIFKEVHTQSHIHTDRRNILLLFTTLLNTRTAYLVDILGVNFVFGYIQAIDGEKDPRNLVIIFDSLPTIIQNFPLGELAEDLFEVISCYFPVDFDPPPNNPFGITREDLECRLRKCLTCTPKFAEFCLPLIQEKVDSSITEAKVDSLRLLKDGIESYGIKEMNSYIPTLWTVLRKEFFQAKNKEVESGTLACLSTLTKCASADPDLDNFESYISTILNECKHHIVDNDDILRHGGAKILEAVAKGLSSKNARITHVVLPILLENYGKQSNFAKQDFFNMISKFLELAYQDQSLKTDEKHKEIINNIFHLILSEILCSSEVVKIASFNCLQVLITQPVYLTDEMMIKICCSLIDLSLGEENQLMRSKIIESLALFCKVDVKLAKKKIVPALCDVIDSCEPPLQSSHKHAFEAAISISSSYEEVHPLLNSLIKIVKCYSSSDDHKALPLLSASIDCLKEVAKNSLSINDNLADFLAQDVLLFLSNLVSSLLLSSKNCAIITDYDVLKIVSATHRVIMRYLNHSSACNILDAFIDVFVRKKTSERFHSLSDNSLESVNIFHPSSPKFILMFEAAFIAAPKTAIIDTFTDKNDDVIYDLLNLSCTSDSEMVRNSAFKSVASIVNKFKYNEQVKSFIHDLLSKLEVHLDSSSLDIRIYALNSWIWMCKACVMAGHSIMSVLIEKLLKLLADPLLGSTAANGFDIILQDMDDVLCTTLHAQIRIMYKQRFFLETSAQLLDSYNSSSEETKPNFLLALTHQMKHVPQQVLLAEAEKLIPVIVHSFSLENTSLLASLLETTLLFMEKHPEAFSNFVQTLINKILPLTLYKSSLVVRRSALLCLQALVLQPEYLILPHKNQVIRHLGQCIDDHKRLVRQAAVQARCEWFLVGSAGNN